ncbi:hypothetical protein ANCDUO_07148 [Ancylostoma duodenale]|uniref:Tetratricopeptide repeat protein n=1 Tax=Ancylostoma duodenale TaxID=51022 RepID=A0A0C2CZS8_9BILA|nr:hypothetical protein ANCDUO_07148 [Ancylostoma duodenale]
MLSDCQQALKYNPRYAKAYFRKARLLEMKKDYEGSLVYIWLHKTVVSDCIRSDVLSRRISEDT